VTSFDLRGAIEGGRSGAWFWRDDPSPRKEGFVPVDSLGYDISLSGRTWVGQPAPVIDTRLTISVDPMDPEMPFVPFGMDGSPNEAVTWVERGLLRNLGYWTIESTRRYMLRTHGLNNPGAFRIAPGPTSVADMIASTERGLLVTRFVNIHLGYGGLLAGNTSDGLWLIEKGKIKEPVKNFRFRESPYFAVNNLEAVGPAERVFLEPPAIAPALKIKDFSMTSLADAV